MSSSSSIGSKPKAVKAYGRRNRASATTTTSRLRKDADKWTAALRAEHKPPLTTTTVYQSHDDASYPRKKSALGVLAARDVNAIETADANPEDTSGSKKKCGPRSRAPQNNQPPPPPPPPPIPSVLVAASRLGPKAMQTAKKIVAKLGDEFAWVARDKAESPATHVVISDEGDSAVPVGLTTLLALARGAWIVRESWLRACKDARGLVDPCDHEAAESVPGCVKMRTAKARGTLEDCLLAGVKCYCEEDTSSSRHVRENASMPPTEPKVAKLIRACNGELASDVAAADLIVRSAEHNHGAETDPFSSAAAPQCTRDWLAERLRHGDLIRDHLDALFREQRKERMQKVRAAAFAHEGILCSVLSFLSERDLLQRSIAVSRQWMRASRACEMRASVSAVKRMCHIFEACNGDLESRDDAKDLPLWECAAGLAENFPRGKFLSRGSYKRVYKVWCAPASRHEALSVMDYGSILQNATLEVVAQEVDVAVQVSELVTRGICVNFIETYQVFQTETAPLEELWSGSAASDDETDAAESVASTGHRRVYQYIRMELCSHGDLEEYLKLQPDQVFDVDSSLGLFMQMTFALHVGYRELGLRHYDVKLLNFFVTGRPDDAAQSYCMRVDSEFALVDETSGLVAKLADYGTASTRKTAKSALCVDHFATLENSPPEYLVLGDAAPPEGADTFALGLCLLHLFTGECPYEEIMASVKCPVGLRRELKRIWTERSADNEDAGDEDTEENATQATDDQSDDTEGGTGRPKAHWSVLQQVITDDPSDTMYHTLYRFAVLLGVPTEGTVTGDSEVGCALRRLLEPRTAKGAKAATKGTKAMEQFARDRDAFALGSGSHSLMARATSRLASVANGLELLRELLAWDPMVRTSDYAAVLRHEAFAGFRSKGSATSGGQVN